MDDAHVYQLNATREKDTNNIKFKVDKQGCKLHNTNKKYSTTDL